MKDFFKFLEEEDKKAKKVVKEPSEEVAAAEVKPKEEEVAKTPTKPKAKEEVVKKLTYNESLVYDDEFKKWIAMSDKIQGIVTDVDALTGHVEKYTDLNEYSPAPVATGTAAAAPVANTQTAPQPTVQQSGKPPMDLNAALRVFKTNPAVAAGLGANPALKPLADFLAKNVN